MTPVKESTPHAKLAEKITSRTARVGVMGLGYVGLPLVTEFAHSGFTVTGFDMDRRKIDSINRGQSYIDDVPNARFAPLHSQGKISATTDFSVLKEMDTVNICVPTPLRKTQDPDMSYIVSACEEIANYIHPGMLIILESTTYPGTTHELVRPRLERSGLKVGKDIFICFSPERVDPGNKSFNTANITKVVGGETARCGSLGKLFYSQAIKRVHLVANSTAAETAKLLENTFRMINIGLVNEVAVMCDRLGIDVYEVIDAAATKPFGFMPFYPGPGLGGHCIPIDPHYLSWAARLAGVNSRFIQVASEVNGEMPHFVVEKVQNALNTRRKPINGSHIHVMGVAYKANIDDMRESPALDVMHILREKGAVLTYSDPHVPHLAGGFDLDSQPETVASQADCVIIVTDHKEFEYLPWAREALIVDTRNALRRRRIKGKNVVLLAGKG